MITVQNMWKETLVVENAGDILAKYGITWIPRNRAREAFSG